MMKTSILTIVFVVFSAFYVNAQNGAAINSTGAAADPSAMLDVNSSNKGVLIPRVTEAERLLIASPARGLMVYQVDNSSGFWYYDGSAWTTFGDNLGNHIATDSLDMTNRKIKNLATCTQNLDAANKEYVDNAVAAGGGGGSTKPSMLSNESSVTYSYSEAIQYCENLNEGGYNDWWLPDYDELAFYFGSSSNSNFLWTKSKAFGLEEIFNHHVIVARLSDGKFCNGNEKISPIVSKSVDGSLYNNGSWVTVGTITPNTPGNLLSLTQIKIDARYSGSSTMPSSYVRIEISYPNGTTEQTTAFNTPGGAWVTLHEWINTNTPLLVSSISLQLNNANTSYTGYGRVIVAGYEVNPLQVTGSKLYCRCVR